MHGPLRRLLGDADEIARDPLGAYTRLARERGDVAPVQFLVWPMFLLRHPDGVRHVLQEKHTRYTKDLYTYRLLRAVVGRGLVTNDGESWLRQRRLVQPAFHHARLDAFASLVTEEAGRTIERWEAEAGRGDLDVMPGLLKLTLNVACRALFGTDLDERLNAVAPVFGEANELLTRYVHMPLPPLWVPSRRNLRLRRATARLDALVQAIIERRRRSQEERDDLLSMLMSARDAETGEAMSNRQLRDEVLTLLFTGHETTAQAVSWSCHLLARHPAEQAAVASEVAAACDGSLPGPRALSQLAVTRRVVDEAMRLYPPAWSFGRRALVDDEIDGVRIPAGSLVWVSPWLTHRDERFWPEPLRFRPDRFLPENTASRPRFAYLPFGSGPRMCLAADFALTEARLVLAAIIQRFRLEPAAAFEPEPEGLLTLRSRNGMRLRLLAA